MRASDEFSRGRRVGRWDDLDEFEDFLLAGAPEHVRDLMRNLPPNDPPRAAYHEAGHAVAAVHFGLPLSEVLIWENEHEQWEGLTDIDWASDEQPLEIEAATGHYLVYILAGIPAQAAWNPNKDLQAWADDEDKAFTVAREITDSSALREERLEDARAAAASFVHHHIDEVVCVAEALIQRKRLSAHEVAVLVGRG